MTDNKIKLNLGCGGSLRADFHNIDLYYKDEKVLNYDVLDLPYKDNSVDFIYASHLIEHFHLHDAIKALTEWRRVLKPNGILELHYPDILKLSAVMVEHPDRRHKCMEQMFAKPWEPGNTHYCGWWIEHLEYQLKQLGFDNIQSGPSRRWTDIVDVCSRTIAQKALEVEYSIIIPVLNQLEWTQRCIASIKKCTDEDYEFIVISNGSTDGTNEWLAEQDFLYEIHDEPLGYAAAINCGLALASGKYVILLNNDTEIIDQRNEQPQAEDPANWIEILREPFADPTVGIVGPLTQHSDITRSDFIIFFCAMIDRKVINKIGGLDEDFRVGAGEDTWFCYLAEQAGFKLVAPKRILPIYHAAEITMHAEFGKEKWDKMYYENTALLQRKYDELIKNPRVTIIIPTRDRYSQLAQLLHALWKQTYRNFQVIIIDDSESQEDIRKRPDTLYTLKMTDWELVYGPKKGPHYCHQIGIEKADTELILRIDDDEIPNPDVLEKLVAHFIDKPDVGAVGGLVLIPGQDSMIPDDYRFSNQIDQPLNDNVQCYRHPKDTLYDVEHLTSTFMYRKSVADEISGYHLGYSKVGHREETDFSYRISRAGYRLIVDTSVVTWHYRSGSGGIRQGKPPQHLWEDDDKMFWERIAELCRDDKDKMFVQIYGGIGDHIAMTPMLRALSEENPDKRIIVGASNYSVFMGCPYISGMWPLATVKAIAKHPDNIYRKGLSRGLMKPFHELWCDEYGVDYDGEPYEVYIDADRDRIAKRLIEQAGKPVILISPYSANPPAGKSSVYKDWENDRWRELIEKLHERDYLVWQLGTVNETDLGSDLFVRQPINDAIALLKHCHTFIAVDTWIGHAAYALNKPGIVLWGETNPKIYGHALHTNIEKSDHDPTVQWLKNEALDNSKMRLIEVADVLKAFDQTVKGD